MDIEGSLRANSARWTQSPLIEDILSQDKEAWKANQYRQNAYEVHNQTESLLMVFLRWLAGNDGHQGTGLGFAEGDQPCPLMHRHHHR